MIEKTTKTISKEISFEKSGETLRLTVTLVNDSSEHKHVISELLSSMFSELLSEL